MYYRHIPIAVQLFRTLVQGRTSRLMHFAEQRAPGDPGDSMAPWEVSKSPRLDDDWGYPAWL